MKSFISLLFVSLTASLLTTSTGWSVDPGLQQLETGFTSVAKEAIPSVVSIQVKTRGNTSQSSFDFLNDDFFQRFFGGRNEESKPQIGIASGFIVSNDGYILTNNHVVKDATEISVTLNDGRQFPGKLIGQDSSTDIALIKIDAKDLPYLKLGNSDNLKVGQWVVAIGNSLGLQASLTVGVVSAKGRNNLDLTSVEDFIQTDAAINLGNSGGPLLNLAGEVIGVNTAIASNMSGGYMGIGFAVPSNIAKHDMDELLENGTVTRGFVGVFLQPVDQDLAHALGLEKPEGALIADVSKDSPAEKAGLRAGDVILKYNNQFVTNTGSLRNAISLMKPGTKISLLVQRQDKSQQQIVVEIAEFNSLTASNATSGENSYGFEVQNLTPELAASLKYGSDQKGVVITKINPSSVAALANLKKGMLITQADQQNVDNIDDFNSVLQKHTKDKPLLLLIKQGDYTRFVSLRP